MIGRKKQTTRQKSDPAYPILAAERFIHLFEPLALKSETQHTTLAAAYYTLATQKNISCNKSKLHLNSAIALLKKIGPTNQTGNWSSQLAHAYFKRAELLEEKRMFTSAAIDYHNAVKILEQQQEASTELPDKDKVLIAQVAISIADLIVHEGIDYEKGEFYHPLAYVNKALEQLAEIAQKNDDIWSMQAYAHQIAGIALSQHHFEEAKEAFRVALVMAFKTETIRICPLLADIYTCLGLLYEQQYYVCPIEKTSDALLEHAAIYFSLSLFFTQNEIDEIEDDIPELEALFDMIYRALDPYLCPLSHRVICDLIDALIFTYWCLCEQACLHETQGDSLKQAAALETYAQHIYWLILEAHHKQHPRTSSIPIFDPHSMDLKLEIGHILPIIQNIKSNNVHYLAT